MPPKRPRNRARIPRNEKSRGAPRGVASVEYLLVLSLVFLGGSLALYALGPPLWDAYRAMRDWCELPFP